MRVIFFGTAPFAVPSLERLAARHAVVLCVTQPDRPQGRGLQPDASPVKQAARRLGVPLAQPERLTAAACRGAQADIGVVAAYGQLIRREVLDLPRHGILGVHPSLLPKYRGAAPVPWALLRGETVTGVTIFRLNEALDAGDILLRHQTPIDPQEDAAALLARLAALGADELVTAIDLIDAGRAAFTPQDEAQASLAPKLTKAQGRVDWRCSAEEIVRLIRATAPWPGAASAWRGGRLIIWSARAVEGAAQPPAPGTVASADAQGLVVAAGRGAVQVVEIQPAGKRRMSAKEFLAGHQVKVGDRLERVE